MGFWPGWITAEVQNALEAIDAEGRTKDTAKKWATVLMLAEGMAAGRGLEYVLREDNSTCALSTWQGKGGRKSARAWGRQPEILEALEIAKRAAIRWRESAGARARDEAAERIRLEAPGNVNTLIAMRDEMTGLATESEDETIRIRAAGVAVDVAGDMLDRAGTETAGKSQVVIDYTPEQLARDREQAEREREAWRRDRGLGGMDPEAERPPVDRPAGGV